MTQCVIDVLGLTWLSAGQREDVLELCLDLGKQLPWIRLLAERSELCEPFWREGLRATKARVSELEGQLARLRRDRSAELSQALSTALVRERLTEVPGIGSTLSDRIIRTCFHGRLRDLHSAHRVQGIGSALQGAISAWVVDVESEFPRLLAKDFSGKQRIVSAYADRDAHLRGPLASQRALLKDEDHLYQEARAAIQRLRAVKPAHFRRALRRYDGASTVPAWYFQGVYPPWEPVPEWFERLLRK